MIICLAVFVHGPQAAKASDYMNTQSLLSRERIRVVPSVPTEDPPQGSPLEASIQNMDPIGALIDIEQNFGPWIMSELKVTNLGVNGHSISPPSWIIEDIVCGGVSVLCKSEHRLPVVSWWLGTAAFWIR